MNSDFYKSYKVNKIDKTLSFQAIKYFFFWSYQEHFPEGFFLLLSDDKKGFDFVVIAW